MKRSLWIVAILSSAGAASAQEESWSITAGVRAWRMDWTTFSYIADEAGNNIALTQKSASEKVALMPSLTVRYGRWLGTVSGVTPTRLSFDDDTVDKRSEWDASVGYSVLPGLTATLGYKRVTQRAGTNAYRPGGPVLGVSANVPIGEGLSLYGSLGLGRFNTPSGDQIKFKATYSLTEVGLGYALNTDFPRWTLTGGYRMQVMRSKEAFDNQDGRDTTQGVTLGLRVTF